MKTTKSLMNERNPEKSDSAESPKAVLKSCWASASDEELLEVFLRSDSRDAINTLILRHAQLVDSVISRHLRDHHEREEAFQATFLVLMQSARKIRRASSVGSFLYGVALRISKRIQSTNRIREAKLTDGQACVEQLTAESNEPFDDLLVRMQSAALDEEIQSLSDSMRVPLVEHYMSGRSVPEIAEAMHLSVSAVEGRIKRAKQILRSRLALRGMSVTAVLMFIQLKTSTTTAAEIGQWTTSSIDAWRNQDPILRVFPNQNHSTLQKLVHGELTMKRPLWLLATGVACTCTILGMGLWQAGHGRNSLPGGKVSITSVIDAEEAPVLSQQSESTKAATKPESDISLPNDKLPNDKKEEPEPDIPGARNPGLIKWQSKNKSGRWVFDSESSEDRFGSEIRERMSQFSEFAFQDISLKDCLNKLSDKLDIDIWIDQRALSEAGISEDEIVNYVRTRNVKYLDAIVQILTPLDLTYTIQHGAIIITTQDHIPEVTRCYDLSQLFPDNSICSPLLSAIRTHITPDTWESNGGASTLSIVGSMLIVTAKPQTHQILEDFLIILALQSVDHLKELPPAKPLQF